MMLWEHVPTFDVITALLGLAWLAGSPRHLLPKELPHHNHRTSRFVKILTEGY